MAAWCCIGCFSFPVIIICAFVLHGAEPWNLVGAVALVVFSVFLYTLPSVIACASVHPSRSAIYFVNWLLGWTVLGWLIAMIWSLSGINARNAVLATPVWGPRSRIPVAKPIPDAVASMAKPVPGVQSSATEPTPVPCKSALPPAFVNCPKCGVLLLENARFCQGCGAAIAAAEPMPDAQGAAPVSVPQPQPKARKSKFKTLLKIAGLMGTVVVLAIVILMVATPDAPLSPQAARDAAALKAVDDKDAANKPAANAPSDVEKPLDYSKPVFTHWGTFVCPQSLFYSVDADIQNKLFGALHGRNKELGCVELRGELLVHVSKLMDGFASVSLSENGTESWFALESGLTNKVPGQSDAEAADLAVPHVFLTPEKPVPQQDSNSVGVMFLTSPWPDPILRGSVVAARMTAGGGAFICPDENTFAATMNATFQGTKNDTKKPTDNWYLPRRFGCSYVPPGTPMVSEGGNAAGSLVVVTATLPDGRTVSGVTGPSEIVRAPQQIETANQQVQASNLPANRSVSPQETKPTPVEKAKPSAYQPEITQEPTTAQPPGNTPATVADIATSKELNAAGLRLLSARQSDFSEARRTFEKAIQLDSSNIEALNNLGYVYSRIGDYRSAEDVLLKVLAVAPTRRVAHGNLGYVQAKLGKTQEAVNQYCQYVRQFDSLERGKSALVRANAADPDPNVQAAIKATVANCAR